MTVLNQPFAVMLDNATMSELLHLRGHVPFTFPAPMIGGTLQGHLTRGSISRVDARPALAVDFDATGPMVGPLPDHSGMSITGSMRMSGTAYYAVRGPALLLALHETLTITGRLRQPGHSPPSPSSTSAQSKPQVLPLRLPRLLRTNGSGRNAGRGNSSGKRSEILILRISYFAVFSGEQSFETAILAGPKKSEISRRTSPPRVPPYVLQHNQPNRLP